MKHSQTPDMTPIDLQPTPTSFNTTLFVSNLHCPSCVSYAENVLRPISEIQKVDISVIDQTIRVEHTGALTTSDIITNELVKAAFEVEHITIHDARGDKVRDTEYSLPQNHNWSLTLWSPLMSRAQRKHIENCKACQTKSPTLVEKRLLRPARLFRRGRSSNPNTLQTHKIDLEKGFENILENPAPKVADPRKNIAQNLSGEWIATLSIEGMTCASCVGTITRALENMSIVQEVNVNLVTGGARIRFYGSKEQANEIQETIEDAGYNTTIDSIQAIDLDSHTNLLIKNQSQTKMVLSIDGMTCGTCVGTITRGLKELPFIINADIDLVSHSGNIVYSGENKQKILDAIDDLGFDATVINTQDVKETSSIENAKPQERELSISIKGMYCDHCPTNLAATLDNAFGDSVVITKLPTIKNPCMAIKYIPSPPHLTIRRIISVINASHEAFSASVYHPPSVEERSKAIRHRDQMRILIRLLFASAVAIPTFIIGVVFMSLVPTSNNVRSWLEQPIWAGNVSREEWALFITTTPIMFFGADIFHTKAMMEIKYLWRKGSKIPILQRFYRFGSMNLLISAGTAVAYFSSLAVLIMDACSERDAFRGSSSTYFDSVTFLTFFILIGRFLEAYSKAQAGDAVALLSSLRPSDALLVGSIANDTIIEKVSVDLLEVGDIVTVPHGMGPPTDGLITEAAAFLFDESSLTGESKPVKKDLGSKVFAGSINVSDPCRVQVTDIGGKSMLDQIVAVVREGQGKRAPIERIADVITGYFVPVITFVAISTWIVWLTLGESGTLPRDWLDVSQGGWPFWSLEFAIAVFVVACPCGIGLAAPTALYVGGGLAAKNHILVQGGGEAFQEASKIDVMVFDKTGTLTEGKMEVTESEWLSKTPIDPTIPHALIKALEESSSHPIAGAINKYCSEKLGELPGIRVKNVETKEILGQGMRGVFVVENLGLDESAKNVELKYEAAIGNRRLLDSLGNINKNAAYYIEPLISKYQTMGHSIAIFSYRRVSTDSAEAVESQEPLSFEPTLLFAISDPLRPTTASVIQTLQDEHNIEVHMCTGDNKTTALSIASRVSIPVTNFQANVLPQDKAAYVESLKVDPKTGKRCVVAFVGDGTNDTPALAAADVSIALSSGSDVAVGTASFILLNSDLETILKLVRLAKKVFRRVKMNFAWAGIYNICLVPIAAGVVYPAGQWRLSPVWASLAMAASSVSVVCSSLALRIPELGFADGFRKKSRGLWKSAEETK